MLESLIITWGYPLILVGTVLEGEAVLVLGGYAAHRGYLSLPIVMAVAFVGSVTGDTISFWIGRLRGRAFLERRASLRPPVERFRRLFERRGQGVIVILRFLYGLRMAGPLAIGMSTNIPPLRFVALDVIGALLWAPIVGGLGYALGEVALRVIGRIERFEVLVLLVVASVAAIRWILRREARNGASAEVESGPDP